MRYYLIVLFFFSVSSCVEKKDKAAESPEVIKTTSLIRSDSFDISDIRNKPDLQPGIMLDTTELESKHLWLTIVLPKISGKEFPIVYKYIDSLKKDSRRGFQDEIAEADFEEWDSLPEDEGWHYWINPLLLYKTEKVVSFCFENGGGFSAMPSGFVFNVISYDIEKKKRVGFSDYFRLDTPADSTFWAHIISRSVSDSIGSLSKYIEWHGPINFAFNKDVIYFFFDKYELFAGGQIGAVKKKYVIDHIREEYR